MHNLLLIMCKPTQVYGVIRILYCIIYSILYSVLVCNSHSTTVCSWTLERNQLQDDTNTGPTSPWLGSILSHSRSEGHLRTPIAIANVRLSGELNLASLTAAVRYELDVIKWCTAKVVVGIEQWSFLYWTAYGLKCLETSVGALLS